MQIINLHQIFWADVEKTCVIIKADTDEGLNLTISTPFTPDSVLWDQIKDIPLDNIVEHIPPPPPSVNDLVSLQNQLLSIQKQIDLLKEQIV